ncbi:hypothetical protein BJ994_002017 [Arthrobacter pigmenti]|uniref:Protein-glutamine gamma-glutamyltransferase-like C-terminal domain-containing protein n=1 Tax=Arthrobacter pigmenti TaxID=271432 RepID=A0A846RXK4_9MICC|nr:DUF4129 domain-containing protein [Arthrobacter pigmenti]NJC22941.1 hypothetical protein [Arthrobacter pigmenti]
MQKNVIDWPVWAGVPVQPDDEEARQLLQEELSKPVYQEAEPSLLERIWTEILNWLGELLGQIRGVDAGLGTILLAVGAAVVIVIAVLLVRPRLNARRKRSGPAVFEQTSRLSAEAHRALADEAAAGSNWDEALTERFRAITRSAEERLVLDDQPGRTAGEVADRLQGAFSAFETDISWLALRFNEVHYGARPATPSDYERSVALDRNLTVSQPQSARATAQWAAPV